MKVIIAGSRTLMGKPGLKLVEAGVHIAGSLGWAITEVVCGEANGIDHCGQMVGAYREDSSKELSG